MTQKFVVSRDGNDALTATGTALSFSSDYATHAIFNIASLSMGTTVTLGTISHNLGYIPKTWIFVEEPDGTATFYRRIPRNYVDGLTPDNIDYYVGTANIVIKKESASLAHDFKAVIFTRSPNP